MEQQELTTPDRRSVMQVCGLVSLGLVSVPALAACGSDTEKATPSAGGASSTTGAAGTAPAAVLAKLADIPVGGALVSSGPDGKPIVLVQATAGTVTAVNAACTHKGVAVAVSGKELLCAAHGSKFTFDGAVTNGPATTPLAPIAVKVDGENVVSA